MSDSLERGHAELEARAILECAEYDRKQREIEANWLFASRMLRVPVDDLKRVYPCPPCVRFTQLPVPSATQTRRQTEA